MIQGLGTLIFPLLSGYWFLTHLNVTKYRILRDSGYHLLFRSAIAGCILFVVSQVIMHIGKYLIMRYVENFDAHFFVNWKIWVPEEYFVALSITVVLALMLPFICNWFYGDVEAARNVAKQNGDGIESLIDRSFRRELPVELSLRSRKSYIGYVIESQFTRQSGTDITLIPLASGYRAKYTCKLNITTYYSSIIQECISDEELDIDIDDFKIVIPMYEIVSARLFDEDVFMRFQGAG